MPVEYAEVVRPGLNWSNTAVVMMLLTMVLTAGLFSPAAGYQTEKVVLVVVDGIRDLEGFSYPFAPGDSTHPYIPFIWHELKQQGTFFPNMMNDVATITSPAHAVMLTGDWEMFPNYGDGGLRRQTRPWNPTVFEYARKEFGWDKNETWCIVGKLNCVETNWSVHPLYGPRYAAFLEREPKGVHDLTADSLTVDEVETVIETDQPTLLFINLKMVDEAGHSGDYEFYTDACIAADRAVERIWEILNTDPEYAGRTTMILTTDHGRHLPGYGDFTNHGGICDGCKHVFCLVLGPDTPENVETRVSVKQTDIAPTIGELLGFATPFARGKVLAEAFPEYADPERYFYKQPDAAAYMGKFFTVWSDNRSGNDEIYLSGSPDRGVTWLDTIKVSDSGVSATQPEIEVDGTGVHVTWLDYRAGIYQMYHRWTSNYGASWSDEELLLSSTFEDEYGLGMECLWEPSLIVENGAGCATVSGVQYSINVLRTFDFNEEWLFEQADDYSDFPRGTKNVRMGQTIGLAWCDHSVNLHGWKNWEIFFKRTGPGGTPWLYHSLTQLSFTAAYSIMPAIASDGLETVTVAWAENEFDDFQICLRESTDRGNTWGRTQMVTCSPIGAWEPALAQDRRPGGALHLVWTDYRHDHGEIYHRSRSGSAWSPEERLSWSEGSAIHPRVAIDALGNGFVVWEDLSDTGSRLGMARISVQ